MYQLVKSDLQLKYPPLQKPEGVQVSDPLQGSFIYLFIGKPGSGKTYLMQQLILDKQFYFGKFDQIIFMSPMKIDKLQMSDNNWSQIFNIQWFYDKIKELNDQNLSSPQLMIVIDDFIGELHNNRDNQALLNLIYNRRHLLNNGGVISFIITSQKYKLVPTMIRTCYTGLFIFKLNQEDWKAIKTDNIYNNTKSWENIISIIFQPSGTIRPFLYINKITDEFYRNFDKIQIITTNTLF